MQGAPETRSRNRPPEGCTMGTELPDHLDDSEVHALARALEELLEGTNLKVVGLVFLWVNN